MKKYGMKITIYALLIALYAVLAFGFDIVASKAQLWGALFFVIADVVCCVLMIYLSGDNRATTISARIIANINIIAVFLVDVFAGSSDKFVFMQLIILIFYVLIITLILSVSKAEEKFKNEEDGSVIENEEVIFHLENALNSAKMLKGNARKTAQRLINRMIEDIKYSDYKGKIDTSYHDEKICDMAKMLDAEIKNMINIESENTNALESIANDINSIIDERKRQIRLLKKTE